MVFSSLPVNQFDLHSWQQHGNQDNQNPNFNPPHFSSSQPTSHANSSQAKVNSMVERARLAKVPLPEAALKCPRCESTNTKFCYFNNYNLTQPRHFCKTCRRYWTRGGALRNVPVGGGLRRNKRSKSNGGGRAKPTVVTSADNNIATSSLTSQPSYSNPSILGFSSNLPILTPFQSLGDYNSSNIGLDFGGFQLNNAMSSSDGFLDQWRVLSSMQQAQQLPFLTSTLGLEQASNMLYPLLEGNESVNSQADPQQESSDFSNQLKSKPFMDLASNVKAEENDPKGRHSADILSRNFLENMNMDSAENNEYTSWGGNNNGMNSSWTGLNTNNATSHLSF